MKTILVPTDFSLQSENALRTAASISKTINATILLVHMVGIKDTFLTREEASTALESVFYMKLTEKRFSDFLDKPWLQGVDVKTAIKKHTDFSEIHDVASENNANLIVMSSQGSSGLEEMLIGSNTEKVVRTSEIPVLVIKQPIADFKLDHATFACDFSEENLTAYKKVIKFFKDFEASYDLVYVNTPGRGFKTTTELNKLLHQFFKSLGESNPEECIKDVNIISDYSVEDGIFAYSNKVNSDLIAIPTHGRQGLSHFLNGSITEGLANHSILPVLTVKL